jgi:hypothetical protein
MSNAVLVQNTPQLWANSVLQFDQHIGLQDVHNHLSAKLQYTHLFVPTNDTHHKNDTRQIILYPPDTQHIDA